jgi:hypothetical protein
VLAPTDGTDCNPLPRTLLPRMGTGGNWTVEAQQHNRPRLDQLPSPLPILHNKLARNLATTGCNRPYGVELPAGGHLRKSVLMECL